MKSNLLLLLLLPSLIFSQIDGTINGYIFDSQSQLPLFGANVVIEGTKKGAISDENGFFEIPMPFLGYVHMVLILMSITKDSMQVFYLTVCLEMTLQMETCFN